MNEIVHPNQCMGCGACAQSCPKHCITMQPDEEGFSHPIIDSSKCINCKRCQQVCPILSDNVAKHLPTQAYGAHACDETIVQNSSSGGVFTLLGQAVLDRGGVVFGAAFDTPYRVRHIAIHSKEELCLLRGSKYVQSDLGTTFHEAKSYLQNGNWVLYSGTPCQIAALKSYLGRDYATLLCVDTICHSVPSAKVWQILLVEAEQQIGSPVVSANFRDKKTDWEHYFLSLRFTNQQELSYDSTHNIYMQAFIQGLSTRPSCYSCRFKGENHYSDITLGDFWGVRYASPNCMHENGTSLVLVHTQRGDDFLNYCKDNMILQQTDLQEALDGNPAYSISSNANRFREKFFAQLGWTPLGELVPQLLKPTFRDRCLVRLKRCFLVRALRFIRRQFK